MAFDDGYYGSDYDAYNSYQAEPEYYNDYEAYNYQPEPQYYNDYADQGSYYPQPSAPAEPAWYETAAKGVGNWASKNPGDAIGAGVGAGLGIWGMLRDTAEVPSPDLSHYNQARGDMTAELSRTQGLNDAAMAKLNAMLGGDYGDYGDEAAVRNQANEQLQALLAGGMGAMTPEDEAALAQVDQEYAAKGLIGSDIHKRAVAAMKNEIMNNQQKRYESQVMSLRDLATAKGQTQAGAFQNTGAVVNQGQNTRMAGLGGLQASGLQSAGLQQSADMKNTELEQQRTNQLMQTGGEMFGSAITGDPYKKKEPKTSSTGRMF